MPPTNWNTLKSDNDIKVFIIVVVYINYIYTIITLIMGTHCIIIIVLNKYMVRRNHSFSKKLKINVYPYIKIFAYIYFYIFSIYI